MICLTFKPTLLHDDMYMFGLSSACWITVGSLKHKELSIVSLMLGGAEAVKAITGALVRARKPPSLENNLRKSLPLEQAAVSHSIAGINVKRVIHTYHSGMQWASSTASTARFFLKTGLSNIPLHGGDTADSGDIKTTILWIQYHWISAMLNNMLAYILKQNFPVKASSKFAAPMTCRAGTPISFSCLT